MQQYLLYNIIKIQVNLYCLYHFRFLHGDEQSRIIMESMRQGQD